MTGDGMAETGTMAVISAEAGRLATRATARADRFSVEFVRDWKQAAARWAGAGHGTAFQHHHWLSAWYGAFDEASPLIAIIRDSATDRQMALIPLIHRVRNGVRVVEFADLDLTDYNAPFLAFGVSRDALDGRALCRALLAALRQLPERVDLVRLRKMPAIVDGEPNPLVSLGRLGSCSLNGNLIEVGEDFEVYRASIKRMQLARSWRVFSRNPGAAFRIIGDVDEALAVLDTTDAQQQERMQQLGLPFNLNDEACSRFYRDLVRRGLAEGYVIASALTCGQGNRCDGARHQTGQRLRFPAHQQRGKAMVALFAEPAHHRADDGGAASGWRSQFRPERRQLCVQAALRRDTVAVDGCEHRARLAWNPLCGARSRRAAIAAPSVARRTGWPSARQADMPSKRARPAAPREACPAGIPAHRDPTSRHWPRPHRCFAGIRAAPGPAARIAARHRKAG